MSAGNGTFGKVFLLYAMVGGTTVSIRLVLGQPRRDLRSPTISVTPDNCELERPQGSLRAILTLPRLGFPFLLLFVTLLLPAYPWRHMTATLGYDVTVAAFAFVKMRHFHRQEITICSGDPVIYGHPLGGRDYDPTEDPYYISNLDQPIHDFVLDALEGTDFTNIVHIVLESMREDSFPFQDEGLLNRYIHSSFENGLLEPINTETITPFIASLAEHTLSWHTLWATVPFTHKSMLGCTSYLDLRADIRFLWHAPSTTRLER
jgi:hypothetical protein